MITYPISSNLCKTSSLHCYPLYNFPSFRNSHWRCFVRKGVLRNFAKFTGKRLWQSFFFNTFAGWGDDSWSFSCLLLKISCLFHLNRKMRWEKGNTLMEFKYLEYRFVWRQRFQIKNWETVIWSENVLKENLMLQFSWLEEFR